MLREALIMKRLLQHLNGKRGARVSKFLYRFASKKIELFYCQVNSSWINI